MTKWFGNVAVKETFFLSDLVLNLSHVVVDGWSGKTLGTQLSRSTGDMLCAQCRVKVELICTRGQGIHMWFENSTRVVDCLTWFVKLCPRIRSLDIICSEEKFAQVAQGAKCSG